MSHDAAKTRYPGYDVWRKRDTPSWDAITRRVLDQRIAVSRQPRFFNPTQWATLTALCDCLVAQPADRPAVPIACMLDARLLVHSSEGWRDARLPPLRVAWRLGLVALDAESHGLHGLPFARLGDDQRTTLVKCMQCGELCADAWHGMSSSLFFKIRVLRDLYAEYYSHPSAWNEIGFGGPANPRGYVRLYKNRRDPWEAVEAAAGNAETVVRDNAHVR